MTTEVTLNVPITEKEKELKDDAPVDNGQSKEEAPTAGAVAIREKAEKGEEKCDEKKAELASPKPTVHKANYEKDVVYLYQFSRTPLLPSTSPYCLKVETWLRLAGIKYENVDHKAKFRSKKGQLPFVELNGEEIADSTFIIKELSEKFGKDLDAALTSEQRAVSHALISMIENHLSWVVLWWRAKYPESVLRGYHLDLQTALNTRLPNPILNFCFKFSTARKGMKKAKAHGIGVHGQEEIIELGTSDLRVLSDMLADKTYFFGEEPSLLDVVAFANLSQLVLIDKEVVHPLREAMAAASPNLVAFVARLKERAFPDWETLCAPAPDHSSKEPAKEPADNAEKLPLADDKEKDGDKDKEHEKDVDEKNEKDNDKEK